MSETRDERSGLRHMRIEFADSIAILTLARPPLNLLDVGDFIDLRRAARMIEESAASCVVITGAGRTFCGGADLGDLARLEGLAEDGPTEGRVGRGILVRAVSELCQEGIVALRATGRLLIAAIDGLCVGGGLELALACGIRFATRRARFAVPEIGYGILPAAGGTQRLPRLVGAARAYELLLTGESIPALEALRWGMVTRVLAESELLPEALGCADRIAQRPRTQVRALMERLHGEYVPGFGCGREAVPLGYGKSGGAMGSDHK